MSNWNDQYAQAVRILTHAYDLDMQAYEAVDLDSKEFWIDRPVGTWPNVEPFCHWSQARQMLLQAEKTLVEVLRWRCVSIRLGLPSTSIAPNHADLMSAPYLEQRSASTEPDALHTDYVTLGRAGAPMAALTFAAVH